MRGCAGLGGRCRERAASEGGRGNAGARAVGIDDDLLAFVAQRYGLYAGAGEEPQRLADVEQRGVFDAQSSRSPADERHQGEYVGRTILEPYQFASVARTAVGVGIDPVEMQSGLCEVSFGGGVDDLDVRGAEPPEVLRGDAGERLVAFERHHAAETARQEKGVGAQPAGEVEDGPARDPLVGGAGFARCLFERQRRQDALCGGVRGEFRLRPREVLDLRGDQPGVGCVAV